MKIKDHFTYSPPCYTGYRRDLVRVPTSVIESHILSLKDLIGVESSGSHSHHNLSPGDVVGSFNQKSGWAIVEDDINSVKLPDGYFVLGRKPAGTMPSILILAYASEFLSSWGYNYSSNFRRICLERVLNTDVVPWVDEDVVKLRKILDLQKTTLTKIRRQIEHLENLKCSVFQRVATGIPINKE